MKQTRIEWTESTWNPVSGCTKIPGIHSRPSGCDNCYAATLAERFRGVPGHYYENGFDVTLRPERLAEPLRWQKPRRIFVNSMSDLWHVGVPDHYIAQVFSVMRRAERHTFQLLTKRPERMRSFLRDHGRKLFMADAPGWPFPNVWLGVSIATQDDAWRADMLRQTPAAVRFLSCEPLLGPISPAVVAGMDWVIAGGESGPGARRSDEQWFRDLVDACRAAGVKVFVKQMGSLWARARGLRGKADALDDLPADLRIREYPAA